MRPLLFFIFLFTYGYEFAQKIRFFAEAKGGSSMYYQKERLAFSEYLDVINFSRASSAEYSFIGAYSGKSLWHPGFKVGYSTNTFDIRFNGNSTYIIGLKSGNISATEPNNYGLNYISVNYYLLTLRNEFTIYNSKKFNINPYIDLGLNIVNHSSNSMEKINVDFSPFPDEEFNFYNRFTNHSFIELGSNLEFFRRRLGITVAVKKSIGRVYAGKELRDLSSLLIGIRYNFANFNVAKYKYDKREKAKLKVSNNSKSTYFGVRFSYPIRGKVTSEGLDFYPSLEGSGEIKVASGDFVLVADFPILPAIYAKRRLSRFLDLDLAVGIRSYYLASRLENFRAGSPTPRLTSDHLYRLYGYLEFSALISLYQFQEHRLQAVLGLASWRDFSSENLNEFQNTVLGLQYNFDRGNIRLSFQRSFNKLKFQAAGDRTVKKFTYLDLSVAYDILQKAKRNIL